MQPKPQPIRLKVHVKTMSSETRLFSESDESLTLRVAAPPVKGKANRAIVKWLAKRLGTSSSQIRIVAGLYSSSKVIEINGVTKAEVARLLEINPKLLTQA
jgi:hypothetical protein